MYREDLLRVDLKIQIMIKILKETLKENIYQKYYYGLNCSLIDFEFIHDYFSNRLFCENIITYSDSYEDDLKNIQLVKEYDNRISSKLLSYYFLRFYDFNELNNLISDYLIECNLKYDIDDPQLVSDIFYVLVESDFIPNEIKVDMSLYRDSLDIPNSKRIYKYKKKSEDRVLIIAERIARNSTYGSP